MFLGSKNRYCENDYTTKCNQQIQCDPYQITNGIFHRSETKNSQFIWKHAAAAAAAKSHQSCPTLCDSIDSRPPGSPVPGILQARTLEWVAISFSNA